MPLSLDGTGSITGISTVSVSDDLSHVGDANTKISFPANDAISFETAGSERLRVNSNGQVLLGTTTTPSDTDTKLRVHFTQNTSSGRAIEISHDTNGADKTGAALGLAIDNGGESTNAASLFFSTASSGSIIERLRITSTGQLLVGTGSASNRFKNGNGNGATPKFQFETANVDEQNDISLTFGRNNAFGAEIILAKHRAATVGGYTVVQSDDRLGGINFAGSDGTHFRPAALIQGRVDGTPGTADMPGRLEFLTTADGAATPTERLRIGSDGLLTATGNADFNVAGGEFDIYSTGSGDQHSLRLLNSDASAGNKIGIFFGPANNVAGAYISGVAESDFTSAANRDAGLEFGTRLNATFQTPLKISAAGYVTKPNQPSFHVTLGGGQINSNVGVIVYTDTTTQINHNIGGHYSTSNGRFTAPVAGKYLIAARMLTNSSTQSYTIYMIRRNGTYIGYIGHNHTDYWIMESGTFVMNLSANDYIDCYLVQHSGHGGYNYASFSGFLLG